MKRLAPTLALAAAALLLLSGAQAAAPKWKILWGHGKAGSAFRFVALADDGSAGGTLILANGANHAVFFNGKTLKDIGKKIGPGSVVRGLNNRHQLVGYRSTRPQVNLGDLFNSTLPIEQRPHAFLYGGGHLQLRPEPSFAAGVNDAGVVVGGFIAADSKLHGFAWFTGGLKWAPVLKGNFVDLGLGQANAINNPSTDWKAGIAGTIGNDAAYWRADLKTGTFTTETFPFPGELTTVNTGWLAGGYRFNTMTSNVEPITINLKTDLVKDLGLGGYTSGSVNAVTDSGDVFGDLYKSTGGLKPVRWAGTKPLQLNSWFTRMQLHGGSLYSVADASTNGLFAGLGDVKNDDWGYIAYPPPVYKLADVVNWVKDTPRTVFARGTKLKLARALKALRKGNRSQACKLIDQVGNANYHDLRPLGFYARNDLLDDLDEIDWELNCPGKIIPPHGMPFLAG